MKRGFVQALRQHMARVATFPPPDRSLNLLPSSELIRERSGFLSLCRRLSSSSGPSSICLIKSKEQFDIALNKIRDESSPAVLYFTAAWCGPCRFIAPVIEELNQKYPHVTTYKVDIDEEGIQDKLMELGINSVPRLHFFQCGNKVEEIVGADVQGLKSLMEELYRIITEKSWIFRSPSDDLLLDFSSAKLLVKWRRESLHSCYSFPMQWRFLLVCAFSLTFLVFHYADFGPASHNSWV